MAKAKITHGPSVPVSEKFLVESWLLPYLHSVECHKQIGGFTCICENTLNSVLQIYGNDFILHRLTAESLIIIKGIPYNSRFTTKNINQISKYLNSDQLLLIVFKNLVLVFKSIKLTSEFRKYLFRVNGINNFDIKTNNLVTIYVQEPSSVFQVSSSLVFLGDIKYKSSVTVYFDPHRNKFVRISGNVSLEVIISDRPRCDMWLPRPVSLRPKQDWEHINATAPPNGKQSFATRHSSDTAGRDQNTDPVLLYQPRYPPVQASQDEVDSYLLDRNSDRQNSAVYSKYITAEQRRASFNDGWPHPANMQNVDNMVNQGFFFTGSSDLIRCHQCGIGLKDWAETDDPLIEHVKYASDCQFLIDTIPPTDLAQIKSSLFPCKAVPTNESVNPEETGERKSRDPVDEAFHKLQPRNPHFSKKAARISSFSKWPKDILQTGEELAEAGFFYTGYNDVVRCYACDGGLQNWTPEDIPWVEHARWFPHCAYVRQRKGDDFIDLVMLSAEHEKHEGGNACQWVSCSHSGAPTSCTDYLNGSGVKEPETFEELLEETEKLRTIIKCIRCEQNDANCLFLPCAHHRLCTECSVDILICPICIKTIVHKVKTFMS